MYNLCECVTLICLIISVNRRILEYFFNESSHELRSVKQEGSGFFIILRVILKQILVIIVSYNLVKFYLCLPHSIRMS